MRSLYQQRGGVLHYRQVWLDGRDVCERHGIIGERGSIRKVALARGSRAPDAYEKHLRRAEADGFRPLHSEAHARLAIEFLIDDGDIAGALLQRRHALEWRLHETLAWTGLGHCEGGSLRADEMVVCCRVVDYDLAHRILAADLSGTRFANYVRIYRLDA